MKFAVFGHVERFTGLKEVHPQISIVLHDKNPLSSRMSHQNRELFSGVEVLYDVKEDF
jgi:hypothetical protein